MARNAKLISIAVILTLAIGIGINTGVFTLINGLVLRPRTDSDPATFYRPARSRRSHRRARGGLRCEKVWRENSWPTVPRCALSFPHRLVAVRHPRVPR